MQDAVGRRGPGVLADQRVRAAEAAEPRVVHLGRLRRRAASDYGTIRILRLPSNTQVPGPSQIANSFGSDRDIQNQVLPFTRSNSKVIYGNLLTLPVGDGLLYVQPLYTQRKSGEGTYPQLRFVLASFGDAGGHRRRRSPARSTTCSAARVGDRGPAGGGTGPDKPGGGGPSRAGCAPCCSQATRSSRRPDGAEVGRPRGLRQGAAEARALVQQALRPPTGRPPSRPPRRPRRPARRRRGTDRILSPRRSSRNVGFTDAGWSSSVARWAHNPEVAGSNPAPATNAKPQVRGPFRSDPGRAFGFPDGRCQQDVSGRPSVAAGFRRFWANVRLTVLPSTQRSSPIGRHLAQLSRSGAGLKPGISFKSCLAESSPSRGEWWAWRHGGLVAAPGCSHD